MPIKDFGEKLKYVFMNDVYRCLRMVRITIRLDDETDEKMRNMIVKLVGLKNFHGNLTRFISFAVDKLVEEIEGGNEELKKKLLEVLRR